MTVISDHGISSRAIIQPRPAVRRSSTSAIIVPKTNSNATVMIVYPNVNASA
jgi:hypothetical protein